MRSQEMFKLIHRYLSLAAVLFWFVQASSGLLIVFRWELDDYLLGGSEQVFNLDAFSQRLQQLRADESNTVHSVWASGGTPDRYDVHLEKSGTGDLVVRIDGRGEILRERNESEWARQGGIYDTATNLHATLLAGDIGHWIIGLSGLLLTTNIILGLKLAWPRVGQWRRQLTSRPSGPVTAKLFGWHRIIGLWFGLPGLLLVFLGALLALSEPLEDWLGWGAPTPSVIEPAPPAQNSGPAAVTPALAIKTALALHPGAEFSGLYLPADEEPWFTVRLLSAGEPKQKFGRTAVLVSAQTGAVLINQPADAYPVARRLVNSLFPLHTGQIADLPGRLLSLLLGVWLLTMMTLGLSLYWKRRPRKT